MERLTNHLIVISFDCLSSLDFPLLETLPNFQKLLRNSSYCKNVQTIYPSVTYPCHATIVTGKLPKNHGIINNTLLQPGKVSPDWYWYRKDIQGKYTKACHGYSPEKSDYNTLFIASGNGIRTGQALTSIRLIDEGPTLARLLGLDLGAVDGRVLEELLIM